MRSRFTLLAIVALLFFSMSTTLTYAAPENSEPTNNVYNTIKEAAEARQSELLYLLDKDISNTVRDSLQTGLQLMQEAKDLGDTQESLNLYMKALQTFRATWSYYLNEEHANTINVLEPVSETSLPEHESDEEIMEEIQKNKTKLLERFHENIEESYSSLYNEIEEMMELLPPEDSKKVQYTFIKAQQKLDHIRNKIKHGEIDEAIESLDSDLVTLEEDLDYLNDKNASKTLKKIEKMDHEAQKLKIEKEKKEKKGEDTTREEKKIKEIKEDIGKVKEEHKNNNGKSKGKDKKEDKSSNNNKDNKPNRNKDK